MRQLAAAQPRALRTGRRDRQAQPIAATDVETDVSRADAIVIGSPVHYAPFGGHAGLVRVGGEPLGDKRLDGRLEQFATGGGLARGSSTCSPMQRLLASFSIQCVTPAPTRSGYDTARSL